MRTELQQTLRSLKDAFPVESIYVFGSYARGDERPESDLDLLVVYSTPPEDVFEAAYQIRRHIHERLDIAVDVVVTTSDRFERRRHQNWTIEHTAQEEGVAV